ncbi:MAG: helix-turn-helix domain-containing protein [Deltaproteobacteria bacterium]|nr:helix-turn-helix domain-containing protein [Deltaproteobacteria bacterium]
MTGDLLTLSTREMDTLAIITRLAERRMTQAEAARCLDRSERQVRRLLRAFERDGPAGLRDKRRGRPAPNRTSVREHSRNKRPLEFRPPRDITSGTAPFGASRHPDRLRGVRFPRGTHDASNPPRTRDDAATRPQRNALAIRETMRARQPNFKKKPQQAATRCTAT